MGNNGNPSYVEYSKGFSSAANILLQRVMNSRGNSVDELIYPICFNMRHSIELRLKGAIEEIIKISKLKGRNIFFDLSGSHDIGDIWNFFQINSTQLDRRFEKINISLDPTIKDIADIDATGQTFRYPIDSESKKHLVDIGGVISCRVLLVKFSELEKKLDTLHYFTCYLASEYQFETYTNKLSRADIFQIAKQLPNRSEWSSDKFQDIKSRIISEYQISNNEFSKACNIIQKNYETACLINIDLKLLGLNQEQILELLVYWVNLNPNFRDRSTDDFSLTSIDSSIFEDVERRGAIKKETVLALQNSFTPEYLAGLNALFYFARELDFSENYIAMYDYEFKIAKINFNNMKEVERSFLHIFSKCNLIDNLLRSLYFLNFIDLAERIVKLYELESVLKSLDELRSKSAFAKPDICGYSKYDISIKERKNIDRAF